MTESGKDDILLFRLPTIGLPTQKIATDRAESVAEVIHSSDEPADSNALPAS